MPGVVLFLAPAWRTLEGRKSLAAVAAVLFAASVGVQAIGAFFYPSPREIDWNSSPPGVPITARLWDWKDTQLGRLVRNGPRPLGFGGFE
jgi:hypothetical protein